MGHKAQYIDCLAKLIDLAIELDFVERVYDVGSKAKGVATGFQSSVQEEKKIGIFCDISSFFLSTHLF